MTLAIYAKENNYWISVQNYDFRYAYCLKQFLLSNDKERKSTASALVTLLKKSVSKWL